MTIRVNLDKPFIWLRNGKSLEERNDWTANDLDMLGNFMVIDLRIYGQNDLTADESTGQWILVSCVYKKVLIDGIYQWRYEVTKRYCDNGNLGVETQVSYSTTRVDVESCAVGEEMNW